MIVSSISFCIFIQFNIALSSYKFVTLIPFSYELLMLSHEMRLFLHPINRGNPLPPTWVYGFAT
nr:MAG TPA: hypothetical protein [Caudoviricetes sp.]